MFHSKKIKRCVTLVLTLAGILFANRASADVVLGSFENDLSSPLGEWALNDSVTNDDYVTYAATEGNTALEVTKNTGWATYVQLNGASELATELLNHDFLAYDFSIPAGANGDGGVWAQAITVIQGQGMGYTVVDNTGIPTDGTIQTVVIDLNAAGLTLTETSSWSQLILVAQGGEGTGDSALELTVDNVRLFNAVPEPNSFALIASLAGLVAFRRRRQR